MVSCFLLFYRTVILPSEPCKTKEKFAYSAKNGNNPTFKYDKNQVGANLSQSREETIQSSFRAVTNLRNIVHNSEILQVKKY